MPNVARRIVLTGVSRGIGRAMVEGFAAAGCSVCGCARSRKSIEEVASQFGPPHRFSVVDVADDDQVRAWAQTVLTDSPPDLLINNAALINENAPLWEISDVEFSALLDVNIRGVANVIRHFVPPMIRRGRGVIVNISSGWGRSVSAKVAPYCTTKWAIEGLTLALAEELPRGLAAVPVNPGIINTEMLRSCFGEAAQHYPSPKAWAQRAVPFLLQLGAKDNGQSLSVPGVPVE